MEFSESADGVLSERHWRRTLRHVRALGRIAALAVVLVCPAFVPVASASQSTTYPNLNGAVSYSYTPGSSGASVQLSIDKIQNPSATQTTGALRIEFWVLTAPFTGASDPGYQLLTKTAAALARGGAATSITAQAVSTLNMQPATYYPAVLIYEYFGSGCSSADQYCLVNYENFSQTFTVGKANSETMQKGNTAVVREGAVFSSGQAASQSFLRFYNTGASMGSATVTLRDYNSGQSLGQWTSPGIPAGAELQYAISTVESALPAGATKPNYYSISVQSTFAGYFQHVLFRPSDGTLTNLSTCAANVTADPAKLAGVHSSILGTIGFPSTIVVNNTGTAAAAATLGIYDARDGSKVGTYTTASVPANGSLVVPISTIESRLGKTPSGSLYHYVVKQEGAFTGFIQNLVNNSQAGVITDMSAACTLDGTATSAAASPTNGGTIFSTAQSSSQSFLRFYNTGAGAGAVTATLNDYSTGQSLGQWTSASIPAGAEVQYAISAVETGAGITGAKPNYYTVSIQSTFSGMFQHVLFRPTDGTLTNLSTCAADVTADPVKLSGVHSSLLGAIGFPSSVAVTNTGTSAATPILGLYDARDGSKVGAYTPSAIQPNGTAVIAISTIETGIGKAPAAGMYHYIVKIENSFTGFMQHLVNNSKAGVITDMTTACGLQGSSLDSVSQLVVAAQGGTLTLSDGSSVAIPGGVLAANQTVTLSRLKSLPTQPPSGLIKGVGSTLSLSFANKQPFVSTSVTSGLTFTLNNSGATPTGFAGSLPIADVVDDDNYVGLVPINCASSSTCTSVPISTFQSLPDIQNINVTAGNFPTTGLPPQPTLGARQWNPSTGTWSAVVNPTITSGRTLVLVHGMMSSVEGAFSPDAIAQLMQEGGYTQVYGYDYDWSQDLNVSGAGLSKFLDSLRQAGVSNVDIVAHSEGGPVSLAGACANSSMPISSIGMLGSPVMGTPMAALQSTVRTGIVQTSPLLTAMMYLPDGWLPSQAQTAANLVTQPFAAELLPDSPTLAQIRKCISDKMAGQGTGANLASTKLICIGGTDFSTDPSGLSKTAAINGDVFQGQQNDGIVGTQSAECVGAGFDPTRVTSRPFADGHTLLPGDPTLLGYLAKQLGGPGPSSGTYYTLTVGVAGSGLGSVSTNPTATSYASGSTVTISAVAAPGSVFAGFSGGGCGSASTCTVTMTQNLTVTATFNLNPNSGGTTHTFTGTLSGSAVASSPSGDGCTPNPLMVTGTFGASAQMQVNGSLQVPGTYTATLSTGVETTNISSPSLSCTVAGQTVTVPGSSSSSTSAASSTQGTVTSDGSHLTFAAGTIPAPAGCTASAITGTVSVAPVTGIVTVSVNFAISCNFGSATSSGTTTILVTAGQ